MYLKVLKKTTTPKHSEGVDNLHDLTCWQDNIVKANDEDPFIFCQNLCFSVKGQLYAGTIFL